jgi:hypothetical protein
MARSMGRTNGHIIPRREKFTNGCGSQHNCREQRLTPETRLVTHNRHHSHEYAALPKGTLTNAIEHRIKAAAATLADMEAGISLLCNCMWVGLASLVSCRSRIRGPESYTHQRVSSCLFVHSNTRTIPWLLYHASSKDWKLESRSSFASWSRRVAVARYRSAFRTSVVFPHFSRIYLERQPDPLALASRRSNRVVGSNVQLQPLRRSAF